MNCSWSIWFGKHWNTCQLLIQRHLKYQLMHVYVHACLASFRGSLVQCVPILLLSISSLCCTDRLDQQLSGVAAPTDPTANIALEEAGPEMTVVVPVMERGILLSSLALNTKGAPIVRSAYRISAYRCAIARIGIGQIIADTADYRVAHAQTICSTD